MSQIVINGPEKALAAGAWANLNIKGKWDIELNTPFANKYNFVFVDKQDAVHFALKWT